MLTCKSCIFNQGNVDPQSKELQRMCTRNPPMMFILPTGQVAILKVLYPIITNEFVSCGEYFDGTEDAYDIKNALHNMN